MPKTREHLCGLVLCAVTVGCGSPINTRYPGLTTNDPRLERRSVEFHDPFPDRWAGPDPAVRPRGFTIQRTAPRRAAENAILHGLRLNQLPNGPVLPPQSSSYPGIVRE